MKRKRTNNDRFKCNICGSWIMKELYDKHYMSKRCLSKSKNGKNMILPPTLIPYVNYIPTPHTEEVHPEMVVASHHHHTEEEQDQYHPVGLPIPQSPTPTHTPSPSPSPLNQ